MPSPGTFKSSEFNRFRPGTGFLIRFPVEIRPWTSGRSSGPELRLTARETFDQDLSWTAPVYFAADFTSFAAGSWGLRRDPVTDITPSRSLIRHPTTRGANISLACLSTLQRRSSTFTPYFAVHAWLFGNIWPLKSPALWTVVLWGLVCGMLVVNQWKLEGWMCFNVQNIKSNIETSNINIYDAHLWSHVPGSANLYATNWPPVRIP